MDLDIAKELSRLQERRLILETTTDLTVPCNSLVDLDRRVGKLSDEVRSLRVEVDNIEVEDVWARLAQPYRVLSSTKEVSDLIFGLKKLNRICRLIDSDPYLTHSADRSSMSFVDYQQFPSSETTADSDCDRPPELVQVLELLEEFESTYRQFEPILSARHDLPYKSYASKVRSLEKSAAKLSHT